MIPFLDLKKINRPFESAFQKEFSNFINSGYYIMGDKMREFETEFARYCHTNFCIGTGNGLDALTMIFRSYMQMGRLREGDKVLVAANTYIATILAIKRANLIPVLIEPDEKTFNIDVEEVRKKITTKTRAILATNLYGQTADLKTLGSLTTKEDMLLIVDAAQSHGAEIHAPEEEPLSFAHATAYSFYPTKNLGALGDGGAVTTDDKTLATLIERMRNYGFHQKYVADFVGYNSRLDEIQAAFLLEKLKYLDQDNGRRREMAQTYLNQIQNHKIKLPYWKGNKSHVFHLFVIRVENREHFCKYLEKNEIGYQIHYPVPPHRQNALPEFKDMHLPITEKIHREVVSIPLNPSLTTEEQSQVIEVLNQY